MNRNFGIGILVLCFSSSVLNLGWAAEALQVPPVIVPPYEIQELTQQMLDRDRQNRDKEIAIQELIEENNKLTQDTLARQEDEGLKKIDRIMLSYRNALYSRDQARIMANSERRYSRYGDLIALTEDADAMTGVRGDLESRSGLLTEKFQMLTELENEMTALNEKLKGEGAWALNQKEKIIEGYKEAAQKQQDKIQMLVGKLAEMDRKISRFDEIIAQKDRQIAYLKDNLAMAQSKAAAQNSQVDQLGLQLSRKQVQVDLLKSELENKITQENNQKDDFARQLGLQLSRKQRQVDLLKSELENKTIELYQKEQQVELLKQELDAKTAQSDQMTLMLSDYQKKLESRDNAYNQELRQVLLARNDQAGLEKQIAYLNAQLQEKEAQVVKIKKEMYDLQELMSAKDRDLQAKDLSLSIELAVARQKRNGMPGSDELNFLRTGLKAATAQLKQKDEMLLQIKANADEYKKEFKEQTREFQSLKEQLQNAYEEISRKNKDLKYKDMEITRLKDRSPMGRSDLQKQVMILTQKLEADDQKLQSKTQENKAEALEAQLMRADSQIKDLRAQLNQLDALSKSDRLQEKLKQALDKIDEQGRVINVLVRKLQDAGQSVDLSLP
jgi:chromosome segregation ATPase